MKWIFIIYLSNRVNITALWVSEMQAKAVQVSFPDGNIKGISGLCLAIKSLIRKVYTRYIKYETKISDYFGGVKFCPEVF